MPQNTDEVLAILEEQIISKSEKGAALIKEVDRQSQVVMLATDKSLQLLNDHNQQVFGDGTFRYAPKHIKQLYTFHVFKDGYYVQVAYFLVNDKQKPSYEKMIEMLKRHGGAELRILVMTLDFEEAVWVVMKKEFPGIIIKGCRFHLAQAWQRKIKEFGFQSQYNSKNGSIALFLKTIFGLPCLPVDEVSEFFKEELKKCAPKELAKFMKYLEKNYMMPNSKFPPQVWAGVGHTRLKSTTNGCENFHRHLGSFFDQYHPDIYTFLENLRQLNMVSEIKSRSQKTLPPEDDHIKVLWKEVESEHMTTSEFIAFVSQCHQPVRSVKKKTSARRSARVAKQIKQRYVKKVLAVLKNK